MNDFMKALLVSLAVLVCTVMLAGCANHRYVTGAIDEEAKKQAELFWGKAFTKCGDSFYGVYTIGGRYPSTDPMIYQLKEPSVFTYHEMDEKVITEADKLNGFEWQGTTSVFSKAYRYRMSNKWLDWRDHWPLDLLRIRIRKVKGNWEFGNTDYVAIPCSQVPD